MTQPISYNKLISATNSTLQSLLHLHIVCMTYYIMVRARSNYTAVSSYQSYLSISHCVVHLFKFPSKISFTASLIVLNQSIRQSKHQHQRQAICVPQVWVLNYNPLISSYSNQHISAFFFFLFFFFFSFLFISPAFLRRRMSLVLIILYELSIPYVLLRSCQQHQLQDPHCMQISIHHSCLHSASVRKEGHMLSETVDTAYRLFCPSSAGLVGDSSGGDEDPGFNI